MCSCTQYLVIFVRDRGRNMKTKYWSLKKLEEVLSFTCPTILSGICIDCCIIISIFSYVHDASSCRNKKIVSKVRNLLQCIKISILINYKANHNQIHKCLQLAERFSDQFNRFPVNRNQLLSSIETMIGFSRVFALIDYQVILIDYFVLKSVPKSDQE